MKAEGGTLRFVTADGRTIPRNGYRLEDFVDDDVGDENGGHAGPSREGFCTTTHASSQCGEVREPAAIYRLQRMTAFARAL